MILIKIKAIPNASKTEIVGWENEMLKIRVAAPPEKNEANKELIDFLAKFLKIGKSRIQLLRGLTGRHKTLCIEGIDALPEQLTRISNL